MNKKELSELKKHFSAASDRFTLNRVATEIVWQLHLSMWIGISITSRFAPITAFRQRKMSA